MEAIMILIIIGLLVYFLIIKRDVTKKRQENLSYLIERRHKKTINLLGFLSVGECDIFFKERSVIYETSLKYSEKTRSILVKYLDLLKDFYENNDKEKYTYIENLSLVHALISACEAEEN